MPSPFLYFADGPLSDAELTAACLDGHLVGLGEGYLPADAVETTLMRAASLRSILSPRHAAALTSAAWVWGALDAPPARHTLCRAVQRRVPMLVSRRAVLHDLVLEGDDLVALGDVRVTSPQRTLLDLVRREGDEVGVAARALVARGLADPEAALRTLRERARQPATRRAIHALRALAAAADQADVTR